MPTENDKPEETAIAKLEKVAYSILELPTVADQRRHARAFRESLRVPSETELPIHPKQIAVEFNVPVLLQEEKQISLDKRGAFNFFRRFGVTGKFESFRKMHNTITYRKKFGREPATGKKGALVLTYGEWIILLDNGITLDLPSRLKGLLS